MPYPEGHKPMVRSRIVESAAKAFRSQGIREISVPVIMKGAGLTHGGFYSHFENKDQLVAEACRYAVGDTIARLQELADQTEPADPLTRIHTVIDEYLSPKHRDHTELGCILPALSSEIARASGPVRQAFTGELERIAAFLCELSGIDDAAGKALLSLMVGTLILARSVDDPALSDNLLAAGREQAKRLLSV